jgi:hypothetical protein
VSKRWQERAIQVALWITVFPVMLLGGIVLIGMLIESRAQYDEQHDRCLKNATNGYEIRECH